jgi:hypothetical protein
MPAKVLIDQLNATGDQDRGRCERTARPTCHRRFWSSYGTTRCAARLTGAHTANVRLEQSVQANVLFEKYPVDMTSDIGPVAPDAGAAGRLQVLATEHWSLLATRSLTYSEALGRVTIFLAILSGAVIALALVAQADSFGRTSISIAIPVLFVVLFTGMATVRRLVMLNSEDFRCVIGMNRLRHAYLQMYPDLEPHFVTSQYDDMAGALQTLGVENVTYGSAGSLLHVIQTLPGMLAVIVGAVAAAIGVLCAVLVGLQPLGTILAAAGAFLVIVVLLGIWNRRSVVNVAPSLLPRFPAPRN